MTMTMTTLVLTTTLNPVQFETTALLVFTIVTLLVYRNSSPAFAQNANPLIRV